MSGSKSTNEVGGDEYTGSAFSRNAPKLFVFCQRKEKSAASKGKEIGRPGERGEQIQDVSAEITENVHFGVQVGQKKCFWDCVERLQ